MIIVVRVFEKITLESVVHVSAASTHETYVPTQLISLYFIIRIENPIISFSMWLKFYGVYLNHK